MARKTAPMGDTESIEGNEGGERGCGRETMQPDENI
jgi:hypothetical protein